MATAVTNTTAKAIGSYVGETKGQIRDGFGVYHYPNKFFRYEGEWKEGQKNGHGRLMMADGSFYEGAFKNGEITGHGYRTWAHTKNAYTGQFERGELCGTGVMVYGNGDKYEGGWQNNRREGEGEMKEANGSVYKGSFYQHKKHGRGYQLYSNGDQYDGEWVKGMKQGHGTMKYSDGTIYDGQWRDDTYNGQGSIVHISGVLYEGIWVAGRPAIEAFTLAFNGSNVIEIDQDKPFGIEIFCQTVDGEVANDDGRLLQISAGVKVSNKRFSTDGKPSEHEIFSTPFDFDAEPYPLTEIPTDCEPLNILGRNDPPSPIMESDDKNTSEQNRPGQDDHFKTNFSPPSTAAGNLMSSRPDSVRHSSSLATDGEGAPEGMSSSSQGYLFPIVPTIRTVNGRATFENLYLPPCSRTYSLTFEDREILDGRSSQGQKSKRSSKKGSVQHSLTDMTEIKEGRRKKEKKDEKHNHEEKAKFCKPGDYVVIVKEVTNPPFLGSLLQPAYCHVKVNAKQKRAKSKMDRK
ncbi:MORN repeat-containing protein 1-like [Dendronephthya gigantea]|uniref:MORN repeat-containing protein 1-like n=1 Tax=Dendronephthya gigantea TaxID=151771 RepID=UPI00106BE86E|nr:MORN repeat-containing protein 1-like [Dendronephthya gigantea]